MKFPAQGSPSPWYVAHFLRMAPMVSGTRVVNTQG
jgi:hypothetical protein